MRFFLRLNPDRVPALGAVTTGALTAGASVAASNQRCASAVSNVVGNFDQWTNAIKEWKQNVDQWFETTLANITRMRNSRDPDMLPHAQAWEAQARQVKAWFDGAFRAGEGASEGFRNQLSALVNACRCGQPGPVLQPPAPPPVSRPPQIVTEPDEPVRPRGFVPPPGAAISESAEFQKFDSTVGTYYRCTCTSNGRSYPCVGRCGTCPPGTKRSSNPSFDCEAA